MVLGELHDRIKEKQDEHYDYVGAFLGDCHDWISDHIQRLCRKGLGSVCVIHSLSDLLVIPVATGRAMPMITNGAVGRRKLKLVLYAPVPRVEALHLQAYRVQTLVCVR